MADYWRERIEGLLREQVVVREQASSNLCGNAIGPTRNQNMTRTKIIVLTFLLLAISTGCNRSVNLSYPMKDGARWNYQLQSSRSNPGKNVKVELVSLQSTNVNGQKAFPQKLELSYGEAGRESVERTWNFFLAEDSDGIYVFAAQSKRGAEGKFTPKYYILKNPIRVGAKWSTPSPISGNPTMNATSMVESVDESVTVPAGTFDKCVRIKVVAEPDPESRWFYRHMPGIEQMRVEAYLWFSSGVGLVKASYQSSLMRQENATLQLESYTK